MISQTFRVWDKRYKQYFKPYAVCLDGRAIVITEPGNDLETLVSERAIIEFGTGINDKNGKEIYEGDIIQENLSFDNEAVDGIFKYRVYWNENELCWSLKHIGNESIHDDLWECNSSIEIIGNIHENPELLEDN